MKSYGKNISNEMNIFYKQAMILLWVEAIILVVIGFYPAILIIEKGSSSPLFYLLLLIYLPFAQFTFTPVYKLTGIYTYYSPMLLGYMVNSKQIDLHSGSSFDYLFVMRKFKTGLRSRNKLLIYHLEGILCIIKMIESKEISPEVKVFATSYFFNERTIQKLGFESKNPSMLYRFNLLINLIDITWMYSIAKGKFSIPRIWKVKKMEISGYKLVENKVLYLDFLAKMNKK